MMIRRALAVCIFAASTLSSILLATEKPSAAEQQRWDAARTPKGWARSDATGTMTFFDAATHSLVNWMHGAGAQSRVELPKGEGIPRYWFMDDDRVWMAEGSNLILLSKNGEIQKKLSLPAEVGDMDALPDGLILSYRTAKPYVEKRDIRNGGSLWTYGVKPSNNEQVSTVLHRVVRNEDRHVLLMSGDSLFFTLLDGKKGVDLGQIIFTYKGKLPPAIQTGKVDRGPVVWGWGSNVAYCTLSGSQVPFFNHKGMLLAKLDIPASNVEFFSLELTDAHHLAGIINQQAIFTTPSGGLLYVPLQSSVMQ